MVFKTVFYLYQPNIFWLLIPSREGIQQRRWGLRAPGVWRSATSRTPIREGRKTQQLLIGEKATRSVVVGAARRHSDTSRCHAAARVVAGCDPQGMRQGSVPGCGVKEKIKPGQFSYQFRSKRTDEMCHTKFEIGAVRSTLNEVWNRSKLRDTN